MTGVPSGLEAFERLERIGEGGSAVVYRGVHRTFGGVVAVKHWRARLTPSQARKFAQECALQWELSDHPHVVRLHWAEIPADDPPWLVMELYDHSLADRIGDGPVGLGEAAVIAADLLAGLAALHLRGILHRDVKPANILLKDGRAALGDLGITKHLDAWTSDNAAGSDAFTAPEVRRGAPPDLRSDVYSAAVTVRRLFRAGPPPGVESVLVRGTSVHPPDRYPDAMALAAALRDAIGPAGPLPDRQAALALLLPEDPF